MRLISIIAAIFALTAFTDCKAQKAVSTIISDHYDSKKNATTFSKFPFGTLTLPGEWKKDFYNQISGQYNFRNKDSLLAAVAINRASSYPFYKKGMTSNEFVEAMYEWDSKYLTGRIKGRSVILTQDTLGHFITWQLTDDKQINNHNLFACENGVVFTVHIGTKKWTEEQKVNFIETVYKSHMVGNCCN